MCIVITIIIITIMRKAYPRQGDWNGNGVYQKYPVRCFVVANVAKHLACLRKNHYRVMRSERPWGRSMTTSFTGLGKILFRFISWRGMQSVGGFWERKWQEPPYIVNRTAGEQIVHGRRWKQSKGMAWTSVVTMGMEIVIGFWYILKVWPAGFANGLDWGVWQKEDSYRLFLKLSLNSWKAVWGRFCLRCASVNNWMFRNEVQRKGLSGDKHQRELVSPPLPSSVPDPFLTSPSPTAPHFPHQGAYHRILQFTIDLSALPMQLGERRDFMCRVPFPRPWRTVGPRRWSFEWMGWYNEGLKLTGVQMFLNLSLPFLSQIMLSFPADCSEPHPFLSLWDLFMVEKGSPPEQEPDGYGC